MKTSIVRVMGSETVNCLQSFYSERLMCVLHLSAGLGSTLLLIFNCVSSSVTAAGAQSSGQCETAGVHELQGQVVRDAPQEVSSSANSN